MTLEEVGQRFEVTRERIRQIEAKALRRLSHATRKDVLAVYMGEGRGKEWGEYLACRLLGRTPTRRTRHEGHGFQHAAHKECTQNDGQDSPRPAQSGSDARVPAGPRLLDGRRLGGHRRQQRLGRRLRGPNLVRLGWLGQRITILDDGRGMTTPSSKRHALGDKSPLDARAADDLGRFGMGLKTASFSQCRRLTVARSARAAAQAACAGTSTSSRLDPTAAGCCSRGRPRAPSAFLARLDGNEALGDARALGEARPHRDGRLHGRTTSAI
jgi:hypothetical protein